MKLLLSLYLQNKDLLEEKQCQASTEKKKNMKWKEMADHINSEGSGAGRTVAHLKKKIRDMKYNSKTYFDEKKNPKTGGGKGLKKLWYYNTILDQIFGNESDILHGIRGEPVWDLLCLFYILSLPLCVCLCVCVCVCECTFIHCREYMLTIHLVCKFCLVLVISWLIANKDLLKRFHSIGASADLDSV